MFDIQEYLKAHSLAEAVRLLIENPEAHLVAGGTDVLVKLRHLDPKFTRLVDIHELPELKGASLGADGALRLGAAMTFTETMECDLVKRHIPILAEAAGTVAGPQIRNMGTIGGNIANGATSADTAAPLLALEADLEIIGPGGAAIRPLAGFHTGPGQVDLKRGEILAAFIIRKEKYQNLGAAYYKYAMRQAMDIATIGCAAGLVLDGGVIKDLRLALTVAAPTPVRCPAAEAAGRGLPLNDETIAKVLAALPGDVKPRDSWRAAKDFRLRIINTLAERMIRAAGERAKTQGVK